MDFKKAQSNKKIDLLINSKINHGSFGETYSSIMKFLPKSTRIVITPTDYYDGMIFIYEVTPLSFN